MDDMAVVGHPTTVFSFSFLGKGTDSGLGGIIWFHVSSIYDHHLGLKMRYFLV